MSKLTVGQIEGLASEGYKITVPSGSKIIQAGAVLQVVSATKTDTYTTTSTTFANVTGLTATITPSATTSKVLVIVSVNGVFKSASAGNGAKIRLVRGGTQISHLGELIGYNAVGQVNLIAASANYLDSPNTTSATTYDVQLASFTSGQDTRINDAAGNSTITLLEIAV